MSLTPHGPSFSFLDSFEVTVAGREGRGRKWLDPQMSFFADHFPGQPLMPGVLMIECAAQTAGALWVSTMAADAPPNFVLAQVLQFKMQVAVNPGDTVESTVSLEHHLGALAQFTVTMRVNQMEVSRGRIVLSRPPDPLPVIAD